MTLAWQIERMQREHRLKPLRHYLDEVDPPADRGAAALISQLRALKKKGAPVTIKRIN